MKITAKLPTAHSVPGIKVVIASCSDSCTSCGSVATLYHACNATELGASKTGICADCLFTTINSWFHESLESLGEELAWAEAEATSKLRN